MSVNKYEITEVAKEFGKIVDDIRILFSEVRSDWDTFKELTEAEYEFVKKTWEAVENNQLVITASDPGEIPLADQEKIVMSASQILGQKLTLSIHREIALNDALQTIKNQVIISNTINSQRILAQQLEMIRQGVEGEYLSVISFLGAKLAPQIEVDTASDDPLAEVRKIQEELGKQFVK